MSVPSESPANSTNISDSVDAESLSGYIRLREPISRSGEATNFSASFGDTVAAPAAEEQYLPEAIVRGGDDFGALQNMNSVVAPNLGAPFMAQQNENSTFSDLDILWGNFDTNAELILPTSYASNYPLDSLTLSHYGIADSSLSVGSDTPVGLNAEVRNILYEESGSLSEYGSRLPSVQPEVEQRRTHKSSSGAGVDLEQRHRSTRQPEPASPWRISREDYSLIFAVFQRYGTLLPSDFKFPSRHALCRYVEGFFSGFHEHLPFLHLPTVSMCTAAPELVLAIAAMGAQYRFERKQAYVLYKASRALVEHRVHRWDAKTVPFTSLDNPSHSVSSGASCRAGSVSTTGGTLPQCGYLSEVSPSDTWGDDETGVEFATMQAMIIIITFATWNHQLLLKDAFSTANQLATLMRERGLLARDDHPGDLTWKQWVQAEGRRRTKLVAYCLSSLHSIAYNTPPKLMNSEICLLNLPLPERQWKASNEAEWNAMRDTDHCAEIAFRDSYAALFASDSRSYARRLSVSSFGNYVLIHCIVQQIFFARESPPVLGESNNASLRSQTIATLEVALRRWQHNWEVTHDSTINPQSTSGPLGFNSTAIFRIAYIRLHVDLGPCRKLETRNPVCMARAFCDAPLPPRSSQVYRAVLQSAHSLSIPVRIGIEFVARTQTLTWSIVHSLGNLECALFLSKWLQSMAVLISTGEEPLPEERRLLRIIGSILNETDLGSSIQREQNDTLKLKHMASAIVRLWADALKGAHVFELTDSFGAGLELYARMLDNEIGT